MRPIRRGTPRFCDCGRKARYMLRVKLLRADLDTAIHITLYLCERCYLLERDLERGLGNLPQARRL